MPDKKRQIRAPNVAHIRGVDYQVEPIIDPTENVIALTEAANRRQDDLRSLTRELFDREIEHVKELVRVRAEHQHQLDLKESVRLDSIRQVDREEVTKAAAAAQQAIGTLAISTTTVAETLRAQQESKSLAAESRQMAFSAEMNKRISAVELSLSEGKGKQAVADPMMAELVAEMRTLTAQRASESGKQGVTDPLLIQLAREVRELVTARAAEAGVRTVADPAIASLSDEVHRNSAMLTTLAGNREGISDSAKATIGAVALLSAVLSIGGMIYAGTRSLAAQTPDPAIVALTAEVKAMREARTVQQPSVIYVPAGTPMLPTTPPQPTQR